MNANRTTPKRSPGRKAAKSRRIEVRVSPSAKIVLERASAMSGRSISQIVLQGAEMEAQRILDDAASIKLNTEESLRFAKALLNPPPAPKRLLAALERHNKRRARA